MLNTSGEEIEIDDEALREPMAEYIRQLQLAISTNLLDEECITKIHNQLLKDNNFLVLICNQLALHKEKVIAINAGTKALDEACSKSLTERSIK
jgi:hypothetical protein